MTTEEDDRAAALGERLGRLPSVLTAGELGLLMALARGLLCVMEQHNVDDDDKQHVLEAVDAVLDEMKEEADAVLGPAVTS